MISGILIKFIFTTIILGCIVGILILTYGAIKTKSVYLIVVYVFLWLILITLGLKEIGL